METQGLPAAVEAARPEPGAQQHGGVADDGAPSSGPARRPPPRDSAAAAAAGASGLDVTFPVLLLLEGKKPPEPPPEPRPPPATTSALALPSPTPPPVGAAAPGPQDSDALLLVLNLVRGGAAGSPSPEQPPPPPLPPPPPRRGEKPGGDAAPPAGPPSSSDGAAQREDSGPGASSFSGTLTINNQSLLVRFENGLLSLGGPTAQTPPPPPRRHPRHALPPSPALEAASGGGGPPRTPVVYPCPEPRCAETFSRKQLLRLHRLSAHGGSAGSVGAQDGGAAAGGDAIAGRAARPFSCPVPGCAWAFATAYKLRRHLHSHDKLRPFACSAPGCTKRFTTIYNLRAHGRAHEQEAAHKCEACGQRFPSAARLGAHQRRSHLEPDRPYRCEYPGNWPSAAPVRMSEDRTSLGRARTEHGAGVQRACYSPVLSAFARVGTERGYNPVHIHLGVSPIGYAKDWGLSPIIFSGAYTPVSIYRIATLDMQPPSLQQKEITPQHRTVRIPVVLVESKETIFLST